MKKKYSLEELYFKAANYCAYQERCEQDVYQKLKQLEAEPNEIGKVVDKLYEENFLNQERYARSFTRGHFEYKKWGKLKINYALKSKKIPTLLIKKALKEIEEKHYRDVLSKIIIKKRDSLKKDLCVQEIAQKVRNYAASKGFESELIKEVWNELN